MEHTATYSPEDNKLRLYPAYRLDKEEYNRVKSAGFSWAPKQELFVAPMWTPSREDLLLDMCEEIGDEDRSLVDRAEERSERFMDYKESRIEDAQRAQNEVERITDGIPLGQPILVGHHSERHARKDAERIRSGMQKTVQMWKTAKYWESRAAGAIRHAKYKELPGVRHRRIKGLESDYRKHDLTVVTNRQLLKAWTIFEPITWAAARRITNDYRVNLYRCYPLADYPRKPGASQYEGEISLWSALGEDMDTGIITPEEAKQISTEALNRQIEHAQRWSQHLENRIAYEKAMLGESGGLAADAFQFEVGGKVLVGDEWLVILKINKSGDAINSLTTTPRRHFYGSKYKADIETVKNYQAPAPEETAAVKAATKLPPMCNYPGEGFKHMTTAEWKSKKMSDVSQSQNHKATDTHEAHRTRSTWGGGWKTVCVFLTDSKQIDPPAKPAQADLTEAPTPREILANLAEDLRAQNPPRLVFTPQPKDERIPTHEELHTMKTTQVVSVSTPQLFPTPAALAARMVELAEIEPGHRILEPSAGTGSILKALPCVRPDGEVVAVEISSSLLYLLEPHADQIVCGDFLEQNGNLGTFDAVLMNPPFKNGDDIKHIKHALHFVKPGGKLIAICANGPRQREQLGAMIAEHGGEWEDLPAGTFSDQGTNVNTALISLTK